MSFHFVARRGRIDPGYVAVRSCPMRLHDPSAFDALDDIGTITTVDIGCKQKQVMLYSGMTKGNKSI